MVNRVRVQVGEQAQAVAGELLPRRAEPRSDGWTSSPGPQDLLKRVQNHRIDLADALARRAELGRELDDPPSEVRGLIERHEQLRELEDEDPVRTPRTPPRGHAERHGAPRGLGDRRGPVGAACGDRTQLGKGEEMATQEQKIVQALGGGAGSTHLMCPHCGKRVDLTYRSAYELALDLAVREPRPDEEVRPGDKG